MKRSAGFFALFAFLVTGARFASGPAHATNAPAAAAREAAEPTTREARPPETTCEAFAKAEPAQAGSGAANQKPSGPGEITALVEQYLYGASQQSHLTPGALPKNIKLMVATVPDPLHTHLSLEFDRTLEAIQQAAQDEKFTYDSSWLPWKSQNTTYSSLSDQETEAKEAAKREVCPGVILFRKNMGTPRTADWESSAPDAQPPSVDPYQTGMIVFIIAEKPTAGLNRIEWENALWWIHTYASTNRPDKALRTLGPTFSGSMPSFVRALNDVRAESGSFTSILLYTGQIRGCSSWRWLKSELDPPRPAPLLPVRIADFEENDAVQSERLFQYLKERGHRSSEVAILSEDETAYGGLPDAHPAPPSSHGKSPAAPENSNPEPTSCEPDYPNNDKPVHLYYPRDISAVRSAYQEQSIFSSGTTNDSSTGQHTVLHPESGPSAHNDTDTIEPFSGPNMALTQEAQLYGIVNTLKTHGIRFVVLRSTNSLDYLFLTRFLHRAYPTAYIVTIGTDMLFGREIDSTEFRGVVALSPFPLLPRGQDWTRLTDNVPQHAHRVFGSYAMEGDYIAARFLITDPEARPDEPQPFEHDATSKVDLPDFAPPFWDRRSEDSKKSQPSTWLAIIGRDGYWPLAVLQYPSPSLFSNAAVVTPPPVHQRGGTADAGTPQFLTLSSDWKFCCALAVLLICMHFYACHSGWKRQDFGMFIQFAPSHGNRGPALIALGWSAICSLLLLLFLASFRIYPWLGGMDRAWVGLTGVAALAGCVLAVYEIAVWRIKVANKVVSQESEQPQNAGELKRRRRVPNLIWITLALLLIGLFAAAGWQIIGYGGSVSEGVTTAYRSVHLTSGVSPVISLVFMLAGFYWWFWQTLSGLALVGYGRPVLPQKNRIPHGLATISNEIAGNIEASAIPFPEAEGSNLLLYLIPFVLVILQAFVLVRPWTEASDLLLHSLENITFSWTLHLLSWIALFVLLLECVQFLFTWFSFKRLLLALNRIPLRRTFAAIQGLSMRSLWRLSGTSSRSRYQIFSHQLAALLHLKNEMEASETTGITTQSVLQSIRETWEHGSHFVKERSDGPDLAMINNRQAHAIRMQFSRCTEDILSELLGPEWLSERTSLNLGDGAVEGKGGDHLPLSDKAPVKLAEEFVCMVYVGYLQNMLARMRTMVLSMAGLFAAIALSVAFYPYTPRPTIALSLMLLLFVIGAVVGTVYAGLDRDTTLSHITNTEPGSLGSHFWLRILSFVGVPALGLIVAQFPEITDFVFSWITPSLGAMK